MPATYDSLGEATSSGVSVITFSGLPATYTDLRLVVALRSTPSATQLKLQFNGDTNNNYSSFGLLADGFNWVRYLSTGQSGINLNDPNTIGTSTDPLYTYTVDIFSYSTTRQKSCLISSNAASAEVMYRIGNWNQTSVINSVRLELQSGTTGTGTRASLYGIRRA